ncbi:GntR family transcriptional regulator [Kribbella jejuensis]|uniref:DNA-binding GntR family transcriptional regulator n=1 Tax=Kribbella jejuensis TaxID=236068 RepID=A0A542EQR0_9ACTN|nr:GntR family transcriptional regulator [Kribbella jejuensis]TQJ17683.1 DNA-binding GntR family transcriptional regulator [Kribbella jejuensis]
MTKAETAYELVRDQVLRGDLLPGAVIPQAALARELGVSTTPLREALRRLMTEGLVELDAHRDARVTRLTLEEARDLIEVRRSLDPLAAGLAAERRTREDLALIRQTADELRPLRTDPGPAELLTHRRFHVAIYTASHNQLLIQSLDSLWDKADRYRRLALEDGRTESDLDRTHSEHRALVDAIAAGDSATATTVMLAHVEASLGARAVAQLTSAAAEPAARSLRGIRGGRA